MKDIWILSVRTSLPETCECLDDMKTDFLLLRVLKRLGQRLGPKSKI